MLVTIKRRKIALQKKCNMILGVILRHESHGYFIVLFTQNLYELFADISDKYPMSETFLRRLYLIQKYILNYTELFSEKA